jgi:RNase adaptor protein for sRNA GlmZ degradation
MRKLPNPPKHVRTSQSGLHKPLQEWLLSKPEVQSTVRDICTSIDGYLKEALDNGEESVSVGVCCQLGKHRSVAVVETLRRRKFEGWNVVVSHRDVFQEKTKVGREKDRQKARAARDRSGLHDPE